MRGVERPKTASEEPVGVRVGVGVGAEGCQRITYGELARLIVNADVCDVHGIGRRRDGRTAGRADEVAHKGGKGALLLAAVRLALFCGFALIAVAVGARAFGARWRGIHFDTGKSSEGGRLAELGGAEARGRVGGV